jgi:hypothetical protein
MIFLKKVLKLVCLLLLCMTQTGCAMLQLPFDLLGAAVGSAVSIGAQAVQLGVAAAPYAAPFFL